MMIFFICFISVGILLTAYSIVHKTFMQKYFSDEYESKLQLIDNFQDDLDEFEGLYITWLMRDKVLNKYKELYEYFAKMKKIYKKVEVIVNFINVYSDFHTWVKGHNDKFVYNELLQNNDLFSDIDKKSLDEQQRIACITDEYSNLIVAGAGSGKTLTIVGKIKYLVESKGVEPSEILCLSFTNKSTDELKERLEKSGLNIEVKTFHKLGLEILGNTKKYGIANEKLLDIAIKEYLCSEILSKPNEISAYIEFIASYKHIPEIPDSDMKLGKTYESLKNLDLETLKSKVLQDSRILKDFDKITLQNERVKSIEELMIANFLFMNGINYEYEKVYPLKSEDSEFRRAYQPDFYLKDYDLWLEHFGINEDGRLPWIETEFEEQKYIDGIEWKRNIHKKYQTKLIETYLYYNKNHELLIKLKEILEKSGVKLKPLDLSELYKSLSEDVRNREFFKAGLGRLINTFCNLYKSTNCKNDSLEAKIMEIFGESIYLKNRAEIFLKFTLPIIEFYNSKLEEKNQIDFNDMINNAANNISSKKIDLKLKYIVIDEYQDISASRLALITAIRDICGSKLICVGDDWQSIYRFSGSDVTLFTNFESSVGEYEELLIEKTYRNAKELVDISQKFILENPSQIEKHPISDKSIESPLRIIFNDSEQKGLLDAIEDVVTEFKSKASITILSRHSFDIIKLIDPNYEHNEKSKNIVKSELFEYNVAKDELKCIKFPELRLSFKTVHKAKGLEDDNVIVINMNDNQYGFPNLLLDDPLLNLLLIKQEDFDLAEERRLFYVAITRTKNRTYLITSTNKPSPFIKELLSNENLGENIFIGGSSTFMNSPTCKRCGSGYMAVRKNTQTNTEFLGCTNYPFCEKTYKNVEIVNSQIECPSCRGYMIKRNGKYGEFYGCTNYPDCNKTVNIKSSRRNR